jgi:hypothetical protein
VDKVTEILIGFDKAKADKSPWEGTIEDALKMTVPRKRGVSSPEQVGQKFPTDVYDSTAIQANRIMAAGLSAYMINSAQRWFELGTKNRDLMENDGNRAYFAKCQDAMYASFQLSNFYQQAHELFLDLGSVGTGCFYEEEDPKTDIRFYARHIREIWIVENEREEVEMVYRRFEFGAWQAVRFFGEKNVGDVILKAIEKKEYKKKFSFLQYVCPRHERNVAKRDAKNMPYSSTWICLEDKRLVKEGGYDEFPYMCPRFYKSSTEAYGYSPAIECLPDILMLNDVKKTAYEAMELAIYPPFLMENDGLMSTLDLRAGALNYQRNPLSQGEAVKQLTTNNNINYAIELMKEVKKNVETAFFVDLFLLLTNNPQMTATEVMERSQEKMLMLSPVLGRLQSEFLNPVIQRTFNILLRRGKIPPPPASLVNVEYEIVYISPLAKAQRALASKDIQEFMLIMGQMLPFAPDIMDGVDTDKARTVIAKAKGIDADVLREKSAIDAIRAQKAKAQQQAQQLQTFLAMSQTGKNMGDAQKGFSNARATERQAAG